MSVYIKEMCKLAHCYIKTDIRFYARWAHRRPKKILTEQEFETTHKTHTRKVEPNVIELSRIDVDRKIKAHKQMKPRVVFEEKVNLSDYVFDIDRLDKETHFENEKEKKIKKKVKYINDVALNTTFDKDGNLVYTKMKDNDARIGTLMLMVKSKKLRDRKEKILLEGKRLIKDALEVECQIEHLMFSRQTDLDYFKHLLPKNGVQLYKMAYRDIQLWSDLTTCPGVMAIVKMPNVENVKVQESNLPVTIVCDNIREPGNLGAILRTSIAVGCTKVILTKGCVDLWEPKVLRSAAGAHFRLKIEKNIPWSSISNHIEQNSVLFLADNKILTSNNAKPEFLENLRLNTPVVPYFGINFSDMCSLTVVIGGETQGLSEEAYKLATEKKGIRLNVPLENNVESLNTTTALGVIIFEMKRQFLTKKN